MTANLIRSSNIFRAALTVAVCMAASSVALCGPIHDAARKGDQAKVVALLKHDPDLVSSRDKFGNTALHLAALHDQPAIAALLLANGADVNAENTPLAQEVIAASYASKKAYGETPLTLALLSYHHKEMVELLLTQGADPNVFVHIQFNALHRAVERDLPYDVELLLANGADPDVIELSGLTAAGWAVMHNQTKILKLLLDAGADPNAKYGEKTLLYWAERSYTSLMDVGESSANESTISLLRAHGGHL